jgi:hypothetical protein
MASDAPTNGCGWQSGSQRDGQYPCFSRVETVSGAIVEGVETLPSADATRSPSEDFRIHEVITLIYSTTDAAAYLRVSPSTPRRNGAHFGAHIRRHERGTDTGTMN